MELKTKYPPILQTTFGSDSYICTTEMVYQCCTLKYLLNIAGAIDEGDEPFARVVRASAVVADRYSFQPFHLRVPETRRVLSSALPSSVLHEQTNSFSPAQLHRRFCGHICVLEMGVGNCWQCSKGFRYFTITLEKTEIP